MRHLVGVGVKWATAFAVKHPLTAIALVLGGPLFTYLALHRDLRDRLAAIGDKFLLSDDQEKWRQLMASWPKEGTRDASELATLLSLVVANAMVVIKTGVGTRIDQDDAKELVRLCEEAFENLRQLNPAAAFALEEATMQFLNTTLEGVADEEIDAYFDALFGGGALGGDPVLAGGAFLSGLKSAWNRLTGRGEKNETPIDAAKKIIKDQATEPTPVMATDGSSVVGVPVKNEENGSLPPVVIDDRSAQLQATAPMRSLEDLAAPRDPEGSEQDNIPTPRAIDEAERMLEGPGGDGSEERSLRAQIDQDPQKDIIYDHISRATSEGQLGDWLTAIGVGATVISAACALWSLLHVTGAGAKAKRAMVSFFDRWGTWRNVS